MTRGFTQGRIKGGPVGALQARGLVIYDGCQPAWTSTYFSHYSTQRKSDGNAATRADFQISRGLECVEFMVEGRIFRGFFLGMSDN